MFHHIQHKLKTHHKHPDAKIFAWLTLIASIGNSTFLTIFPIILFNKLQNESLVSYYYSAIAIIVLIASLSSTILFQKYSKIFITKITLTISVTSLFLLTFAENIWHIGWFDIPRAVCVITFGVALSLFVSDFSRKNNLAEAEGRFYMFNNIGFFIGPLIGGYSAYFMGEQSVFLLAGIFYSFTLILFLYFHIYEKHPLIHKETHKEGLMDLFRNIKEYFQKSEFIKVWFLAFGLNYWWSVSIVYFPLEVRSLGFEENIVGWVVSSTALPLILLEFWVGKLADKTSIRRCAFIGFSSLAILVALFPSFSVIPVLVLIAFGLVNITTAFIEPLQETYFFKVANPKEKERFFGIYNTAQPVAAIISPLIAGGLYAWGGYTFLWYGTAMILSFLVLNSLFIRK